MFRKKVIHLTQLLLIVEVLLILVFVPRLDVDGYMTPLLVDRYTLVAATVIIAIAACKSETPQQDQQ